jgi:hypothetical protein
VVMPVLLEPAQAVDPAAQRERPDRLGLLAAAVSAGPRGVAATAAMAVCRRRRGEPAAAVLVDQPRLAMAAAVGQRV